LTSVWPEGQIGSHWLVLGLGLVPCPQTIGVTVTVYCALALFPALSEAVHVTVVVAVGENGDWWSQVTPTAPSTLSVAEA